MTRGAWFWLVLLALPVTVAAQPLKLHLTTPGPRCRTAAPMVLNARFESPYGATFDGYLHLMLLDEGALKLSWRSPVIVLTGGEQAHRVMLPPFLVTNMDATVRIVATFVPRGGGMSIDLGEHVLPAPSYLTRNGIIAVSDPWGRSLPRYTQTIRSLRLDRFDPAEGLERTLNTIPTHVTARRMPSDPMGYCPFDVVALIGEGLTNLESGQLDAILAWTRAGGSVYVAPGVDVEILESAHRQFLAELGADGLHDVELGRAVIDHRPLDQIEDQADNERQRGAAAFLWKLSRPQREAVRDRAAWRTDLDQPGGNRYTRPREPGDPLIHRIQSTVAVEQLSFILEPGEVRIIPFKIIALIMIGYVLAIGPADYLLLGALRRRKWTWLLFPVVTAAFTWATVALSNHYVGRTDHRRTLTVIDVGENNRALRETRVEMVFTGVSRRLESERRNATYTPLYWELQRAAWQFGQHYSRAPAIVQYDGRFPYRYTTHQAVEQWSPRFSRTMTIAPDRDVPIDFARSRDTTELQRAHSRYQFHVVSGAHIGPADSPGYYAYRYDSTALLNHLTARQPEGFFSVVTQVSPTGGDSFEDLAMVDPQDPTEYVILAVRTNREGMTVYRRKFTTSRETE